MTKKVKVDENKPCTAAIEWNRDNISSGSVCDFKKVVTMPLLDYLTTQLNEWFDSASVTAYCGLVITPLKKSPKQGSIKLFKNDSWVFLTKITAKLILNIFHHG